MQIAPSRPCRRGRLRANAGPNFRHDNRTAPQGHGDAAFVEQVLDITEAQSEPVAQSHGVADDLRRETMTSIQRFH